MKGFDTAAFPVENVSHHEAVEFCKKLTALVAEKRENRVYRLPTEAEWEYACRGGASSSRRYHFGDTIHTSLANFGFYAKEKDSLGRTCKVGSYKANAFGLYDMHGNVWEWCADWYGRDYYSRRDRKDPRGPDEGEHRVLRGGSWGMDGSDCRTASRYRYGPDVRGSGLGFRVACSVATRAP